MGNGAEHKKDSLTDISHQKIRCGIPPPIDIHVKGHIWSKLYKKMNKNLDEISFRLQVSC
jgi:hypothetical protein